jgi:hypothetical protein
MGKRNEVSRIMPLDFLTEIRYIYTMKLTNNEMKQLTESYQRWMTMAQHQGSLNEQLKELILLANKNGLYDAADYLDKVLRDEYAREVCPTCGPLCDFPHRNATEDTMAPAPFGEYR